jgi:hypothetical protein
VSAPARFNPPTEDDLREFINLSLNLFSAARCYRSREHLWRVDRWTIRRLFEELKGSKKVLRLPGEHVIAVRQAGYKDYEQKIDVQPGGKQVIRVVMENDLRVQVPTVTAEIKLSVVPDRAAVFVDGLFVGHVAEFSGLGRALLVAPGKRAHSACLVIKTSKQKSPSSRIKNSRLSLSCSKSAPPANSSLALGPVGGRCKAVRNSG